MDGGGGFAAVRFLPVAGHVFYLCLLPLSVQRGSCDLLFVLLLYGVSYFEFYLTQVIFLSYRALLIDASSSRMSKFSEW